MLRLPPFVLAFALCACGLEAPPRESPAPEAPREAPAPLDIVANHVVALGADWRLDSAPHMGLVFDRPALGGPISAPYAAPRLSETGATDIASGPLTLTLTPAACEREGVPYPMRARVRVADGAALQGCAYARWDTHIVELMPAIESCLSLAPEGARILHAGEEENGGRILVRLIAEAAQWDCRAPRDPGAGPAVIASADPTLRIAGAGDPVFVRAPGAACPEATEVRGHDGALLGWTARDGVCAP